MIIVECPYCGEEIDILFGEEIGNLIRNGVSDCTCDYCKRTFEIYQGPEQYEVREKNTIKEIEKRVKEIDNLLFDSKVELDYLERKSLETEQEDLLYYLE